MKRRLITLLCNWKLFVYQIDDLKWTQLTSLDRKSRAVNAQDIASQLKLKDKKSLKSLKSKNSELLAKYREKLKGVNSDDIDAENESSQDLEEHSDRKLIPKAENSFQGVVFNEESDEIKESKRKTSWRKKNNRDSKGKTKSRFKKFKPFKRNSKAKSSNKKDQNTQ